MVVPSERSLSFSASVGRNASTLSCVVLVLAVLLGATFDRSLSLAVYLLSFWHYYLYWLAFAFGVPAFETFKRDAIAMKTVSVGALAVVYLAYPLDPASLIVIAGGILLNVRAAAALGADRTYYGHEVAGLPLRRITAFPYSLTNHPMILGNVAAFGGTMINPDFRQHWWLLAGLHVALNIGLLVMELAGTRHGRSVRIAGGPVFAAVLACAIVAALAEGTARTLPTLLAGTAASAGAWVLYRRYAPPTGRAGKASEQA